MRRRTLALGLILAARTLLAQEAVSRDSILAGQSPAFAITPPVSGNAWIDLRQNAKPGAVQSVPDWVEAVTFMPPDAQTNAAAPSVFRIRLARPGGRASVLFFRLFFNDQTSARPEIVVWDESGSQLLRSGPLGTGIDLESSESVMIPMHGITTIDVEVPGDGNSIRGAYLEWMRNIVSQMQCQYTGWLRAQKIVPVSALHAGTNNITIINGPNAASAVIRATQIQLKYLWDKSDYILKPDR